MATNPVELSDVEARWHPLSADEKPVASSLLDDAWNVLLVRAPGAFSQLDDGTLSPAVVRAVICAAVLRVLRNPEGNRSESIDDYSWTRDGAVSSGALYFTDDELSLVRGFRGKARSVGFSNVGTPHRRFDRFGDCRHDGINYG